MKKSNYYILIPALLIFILTSYFSCFFHHFDEHYQIIEFAEFINGENKAEDLAWEYKANIRPSLQPYIAAFIIRVCDAVGIQNHFQQMHVLRLISAVFLFICLGILYNVLKKDFKEKSAQIIFLCCSFLFYFIPFLSVRFSSETWSSAFFILGFCVLYPQINGLREVRNKASFLTGLLFGLSFLFRYQSAILIFGVAIYLMVFHLKNFKGWFIMFIGFVIVFIIGVFLDKLFYGKWTISAYNYFSTNLIDNKAAEFGVSPWYWYAKSFIGKDIVAVLNGFIFLSVLTFFIIKRNHVLTYCCLIFIIIHFGIGHKEMRFLFPIAFFIPYFVCSALSSLFQRIKQKTLIIISKVLFACLFIINLGFLFSFSFAPAHSPFTVFEMMEPYKNKPAKIYYFDWRFTSLNLYAKDLKTNYYTNKNHEGVSVTKKYLDTLLKSNINSDTLIFAVLTNEDTAWIKHFELVGKPTKRWVDAINNDNLLKLNMVEWGLYKLKDDYVKNK